jgi:FdrA protein
MSRDLVEVRRGVYRDSVSLMLVSRTVAAVPGVLAAQVGMATELNRDVLQGMGFALPAELTPSDLMVAVRAEDDDATAAALAAVEAALVASQGSASGGSDVAGQVRPRTTGAAVRAVGAGLALVSVPGPHAFTEAMDALAAGANVMVFSDNVPVAHELRLKDEAAARGLLVMGPDCGTAMVAGVGLGFANVVLPGPVALVAASGTGAQQLMCLLDAARVGVSHCLGVGGRDLSAEVGGRSARQALRLLDADPATELIVVVSKPADPGVEAELRALAATMTTPVQFATLAAGRGDLTDAARVAVEAVGVRWQLRRPWPEPLAPALPPDPAVPHDGRGLHAGQRFSVLRGLFVGGTLCDEAMLVAQPTTGALPSNIPLAGAPRLTDRQVLDGDLPPDRHAFVDFGDDALTRGRPHPMIDPSLRLQALQRTAATAGAPATGDQAGQGVVVLLDVVLGHGSHADPAAELAPAITRARRTAADRGVELAVVVSLCGTVGDPQGLSRQAQALLDVGASVHLSNATAARAACGLLSSTTPSTLAPSSVTPEETR